nr:TOMM precursor leader peptide-binding protein [Corynebacterium mendelii]
MRHRYQQVAGACVRRGGTVIPVQAVDGRGVIGPVRFNGQGPCPLCAVFHASDADPLHPQMVRRYAAQHKPVDPALLSVVAGRVAAMVALAQNVHLEPASRVPALLSAGTTLTVDPFRFFTETDTSRPHPRCPVCFGGRPTSARATGAPAAGADGRRRADAV